MPRAEIAFYCVLVKCVRGISGVLAESLNWAQIQAQLAFSPLISVECIGTYEWRRGSESNGERSVFRPQHTHFRAKDRLILRGFQEVFHRSLIVRK